MCDLQDQVVMRQCQKKLLAGELDTYQTVAEQAAVEYGVLKSENEVPKALLVFKKESSVREILSQNRLLEKLLFTEAQREQRLQERLDKFLGQMGNTPSLTPAGPICREDPEIQEQENWCHGGNIEEKPDPVLEWVTEVNGDREGDQTALTEEEAERYRVPGVFLTDTP